MFLWALCIAMVTDMTSQEVHLKYSPPVETQGDI